MGFLDRAIKRGISNAVGNAVEKGVRQAVEPKIEQAAANAVNSAANQINQAAGAQNQPSAQPQSTVNQAEVEQAAKAADDEIMAEWDEKLSQYPKWCYGGKDFNIEQYDGYIMFAVLLESEYAAKTAVRQYGELLRQNGFCPAGECPSEEHLYKMVNGASYHCDLEHCFDGNSLNPTINFTTEEPRGGFDYVKPEPKKPASFKDLFKF